MRSLFLLLLLLYTATACVVRSFNNNVVEIRECERVVVENRGVMQMGSPGFYSLPEGLGCSSVVITGDVPKIYRLCGGTLQEVECENDSFESLTESVRACARDLDLECVSTCCSDTFCCFQDVERTITTFVTHEWENLVGSDGIAVNVSDSRVRVENGELVATCDLDNGEHIDCLLGENVVVTRLIDVPNCSPTSVTVRISAENVLPGTTVSTSNEDILTLENGTNVFTLTNNILKLTTPVDTCTSGILFSIQNLNISTECTETIPHTVPCTSQVSPYPHYTPAQKSDPLLPSPGKKNRIRIRRINARVFIFSGSRSERSTSRIPHLPHR